MSEHSLIANSAINSAHFLHNFWYNHLKHISSDRAKKCIKHLIYPKKRFRKSERWYYFCSSLYDAKSIALPDEGKPRVLFCDGGS